MNTTNHETRVHDFLAQKRIAVAGVSRNNSHHPSGNLIEGEPCYPDVQSIPGGVDGVVIITRPETTEQIVRDCGEAGVRRVWMHESIVKGSSVSTEAVAYCREHDMTVIAGACPMMYGPGVDFGHRCMRWIQRVSGRMPQ